MLRITRDNIFCLFLVILWPCIPILSSILIFFYSLNSRDIQNRICGVLPLILLSFSAGIIAFNAEQGSSEVCDLIRYQQRYETYGTHPFGFMFSTNILFDTITWILSNYVSADSRVVGLFWVTFGLLFLLLACRNLINFYIKNDNVLKTIIFITVILFIPFVMIYELLKQCAAFSVMLYAISLSIKGENKIVWIMVIIAFMIHIASVGLCFPLLFWKNKWVNKHIFLILLISLVLGLIGIMNILSFVKDFYLFEIIGLAEKLQSYSDFSDWGGSKRYYFLFFFYSLQVVMVYMCPVKNRPKGSIITVLVLCTLLLNLSNNHNLARLINVLYPFNIMVFIIGMSAMKRYTNKKIMMLVCIFIFFSSNIIQYTSNVSNNYYLIYMGNDPIRIFTTNIIKCFN